MPYGRNLSIDTFFDASRELTPRCGYRPANIIKRNKLSIIKKSEQVRIKRLREANERTKKRRLRSQGKYNKIPFTERYSGLSIYGNDKKVKSSYGSIHKQRQEIEKVKEEYEAKLNGLEDKMKTLTDRVEELTKQNEKLLNSTMEKEKKHKTDMQRLRDTISALTRKMDADKKKAKAKAPQKSNTTGNGLKMNQEELNGLFSTYDKFHIKMSQLKKSHGIKDDIGDKWMNGKWIK